MMEGEEIEMDPQTNLPVVRWSLEKDTCLIAFPEESEESGHVEAANVDANNEEATDEEGNKKEAREDVKTRGEATKRDTVGWKDLQLLYASRISLEIRKEIYAKLGYTSSTGIAHNKTLAKLISATNKPNKQTVLLDSDTMAYMKQTKLTKIRGMGKFICWRILSHLTLGRRKVGGQVGRSIWRRDGIRSLAPFFGRALGQTLS